MRSLNQPQLEKSPSSNQDPAQPKHKDEGLKQMKTGYFMGTWSSLSGDHL